ncbi:MAG: restriction endonuclease subunit S [Cellvibrio sp.]|uniref:restriction endonuclease subunit S n=1 Tax=Cellvibrio sp. TaxID=1965322 RepID=UPI0031AC53C2
MSRYQAYPEYKDSGVKWLGEVPSHWTLCRIKDIAMINASKSEVRSLPADSLVSFLPMESIGEKGELDTSRTKFLSEVLTGYTYVANGDLMIAKITPCFENGKGAIANDLVNGVGFATTEVIPIRPVTKSDAKFLFYLLNCDPFKFMAESSMYGAGGQKRVADSFVAEYHLTFPSKDERNRIANFLDHETAKIDTLIEQQQQLIQLLKEKRQAVISHAVTKGLNPNAPMKGSGVEWLGEVPEHWETLPISKISTKITNGYVGPTRDILVNEGVSYIQATHIKKGAVNFDGEYYVTKEWSEKNSKSILKKGDVLIVQTGAGAGDVGLVSEHEEGFNCHALIIVQCNPNMMLGEFLSNVLSSSYGYAVLYSIRTGGMHPHLNCGEVKYVRVPVPPFTEAIEINAHIQDMKSKFSKLIDVAENKIEILKERRTALISAAVTGKIDVRNWQAPTHQ